jgi:hypothetical protein
MITVDLFESDFSKKPNHTTKTVAEGIQADYLTQVFDQILDGELDAYDVMNHPRGSAQEHVAMVLQDMYDDVARDHRLHPDDNFEEILDIVVDRIEKDYGHSTDRGVAEGSSTNAEVTKRAKAAAQKAGKTFNTDVEYRLWYAITTQANAATRKADKKQGVAEAGNKPLEKSRFGTGDTRTPRDIKSQMSGASDEFVRSTADKTTGPFHSKVAKMQGKMAKSELRRREQGVAEGYQFKGPFPFDVDHMHGGRGINLPKAETKKYFTDKKQWQRAVDDINSSKYDDNSDYIGVTGRSTVEINGREWARWSDAQQKGYIELSSMSEQGMAEDSLNEFAPGSGGESGRWYTDDQMTDIVGDGWYQDLDVSGNISKQAMIQEAQAWLDDQGYDVQVLNCKLNDDDMEWFIQGSFDNPGFANEGVAEGSKDSAPKMGSQEKKLAQGALKGARDMAAVLGLVRGKDGVARPPETKKKGVAEAQPEPEQQQIDANRRAALRREREPAGSDTIDARLAQQHAQRQEYEKTGKFWIKRKDNQQHISDVIVGKAAANAAALGMLKQQPELRGNIVITAYGPGESQGVAEGNKEEKIGGRHDADDFDDMVLRLKKLAGSGPMKTVYDPTTRRYKNVPVTPQSGDKK